MMLVIMMMMSADGGQSSQHASPDDVRRPPRLCVDQQLVDIPRSPSISSGEVGQRSRSVWNVASEQDGGRGRSKQQVLCAVQWRQPITVSGRQLPQDGATLRAILLRAVFLQPSTGLHQLPASGGQQCPASMGNDLLNILG